MLRSPIFLGNEVRVGIDIELAAASMAVLLDELTSGLGATSSLKALSCLGVAVETIIHLPRTEIYDFLDNVMLLVEGRQLFQGKTRHAQGYPDNLDFGFPSM